MKRIFLITLVLVCLIFSAQAEVKTFSGNVFPISVDTAGEHTYIFDGVTIYGVNDEVYDPNDWDVLIYWLYLPPISFEASQAKLTIVLKDGTDNKLISDDSLAAITLTGNVELIIRCESAGEGHECNDLCGSLTITGDRYGPGIGAGVKDSGTSHLSGSLTIDGGNISIQGGAYAAGIGGGLNGDLIGDVTINGGNVTIQGGAYAAGIGGGDNGDLIGNVTINGGNLTVTGDYHSAGIGGSENGDLSGTITVNGGKLNITGGTDAAGIGGGLYGSMSGTVTINGGSVFTSAGESYMGGGAGIGGSTNTDLTGSVMITGGEVTAIGQGGAGIGGGGVYIHSGSGGGLTGSVTITGGKVTALSFNRSTEGGQSSRPAAIGNSGSKTFTGTVRITGGVVTAISESSSAIGTYDNNSEDNTGKVIIDPAAGTKIKGEAARSKEEAVALEGSPFASKTEILSLLGRRLYPDSSNPDLLSYAHFEPMPIPATPVPSPTPELPATGDGTDFALLIALAAAGLIGMAGFLRRKNEA